MIDADELSCWFAEQLHGPVRLAFQDADEGLLGHPFAAACPPGARSRPGRHGEWIAARIALDGVLPRGRSAIEQRFPAPDASLSHSGGRSVAVFVTGGTGCGVDIERPRALKPGSERHFLAADERGALPTGRDLLLLWTIKEAVFKADQENAGRVLSGYRLAEIAADRGTARHGEGKSTFRYAARQLDDGFRIALAISLA